ncbi:MAG: hypothetical protein GKR94_26240 [Gammaproteobacteria bacterium]|nr:hypothetical protein [Gammaproteobacteria bacterium]
MNPPSDIKALTFDSGGTVRNRCSPVPKQRNGPAHSFEHDGAAHRVRSRSRPTARFHGAWCAGARGRGTRSLSESGGGVAL